MQSQHLWSLVLLSSAPLLLLTCMKVSHLTPVCDLVGEGTCDNTHYQDVC